MKKFAFDSAGLTILNAIGWLAAFGLFAAIASLFGANWQTDAFFLAWTIPALFIGSIANTMTSAFIPVLTKYKVNQPDILGELAGSAVAYVTTLSVLASVGIGLLAPLAFRTTNPELSIQSRNLVYQILLFLLPMITFQMANAVLAAMYNVFAKFWLPALSEILRYVATLVMILVLHHRLGILSLPIGLLIGSLSSTILLLIFWPRLNVRMTLKWRVNKEVVQAFKLALPLILGMFVLQLNVLVTRFLASRLPSGNVSVLDYASRVSVGVMELLTSGVFLVTLANWSGLIAEGNFDELRNKFGNTFRIILFIVTPVIAVLFVLREPVISILFQRGEFNSTLTIETAAVLVFFLIGIPLDVIGRTYVRILLVWQRTWGLAILAVLRLLATFLISQGLIKFIGVKAIALADTVGIGLTVIGLAYYANRILGNPFKGLFIPFLKLGTATLVAGFGAYFFSHLIGNVSFWLMVPITTIMGCSIYLIIAWLLKMKELTVIVDILRSKETEIYS